MNQRRRMVAAVDPRETADHTVRAIQNSVRFELNRLRDWLQISGYIKAEYAHLIRIPAATR